MNTGAPTVNRGDIVSMYAGLYADSKFESAEQRRLAPTIGSPFGTHLPTNADSQSAVGDIADCQAVGVH